MKQGEDYKCYCASPQLTAIQAGTRQVCTVEWWCGAGGTTECDWFPLANLTISLRCASRGFFHIRLSDLPTMRHRRFLHTATRGTLNDQLLVDVLVDGLAFSARQGDVCVEVEQSLRQLLFDLAENTDSGKTDSPELKKPKRAAVDRVEV
ncbi:hypothetical protein EmuJ_000363300 [Echinococcus multilocularis]|uniref:Uncharacterized protein n=1 Tax=Echinococcus multilocularis TaxID=6211 RepID=A0A068XVY6_ECHMU|nr:hypothetical protein EmuJ_000363300 [Echinococcus multilocularis]